MKIYEEIIRARQEEKECRHLVEGNMRLGKWKLPLNTMITTLEQEFPVYLPDNIAMIAHDRFAQLKRYPDVVPRFWKTGELYAAIAFRSRRIELSNEIGQYFPGLDLGIGVAALVERDPNKRLSAFWIHVLQWIRSNSNTLALNGQALSRSSFQELHTLLAGGEYVIAYDRKLAAQVSERKLKERLLLSGLTIRHRDKEKLYFLASIGR